jgi:hypothetical protein
MLKHIVKFLKDIYNKDIKPDAAADIFTMPLNGVPVGAAMLCHGCV